MAKSIKTIAKTPEKKSIFQLLEDNKDPIFHIHQLNNQMKKMRPGSFIITGRPQESLFPGKVHIWRNGDKTFISFLGQRTIIIMRDDK